MSSYRRLFGAVLWIVRTGSPWRDLPAEFGNWSTVYTWFRDWVAADVFARLFEAVAEEPDMEYAMVDATIVTVHRHGQAVLNAGMMNDDTDKVTDCIPDDVACPLIFFPASNLCLPPASVVLTD